MRASVLGVILGLWFALMCLGEAWGAGDPGTEWRSLESRHFLIHYPAHREAYARRALSIAEEAHEALSPQLSWVPKGKTHISVFDTLDEANGWARSTPRNEIRLYAYPPNASSELGHYDDWMRLLIYHEYVHILHIDTSSSSIQAVLNAIFGKFARTNATLPRWYIEGLAIYYETKQTGGGRLRSSLYRHMLRNVVLAGELPSLGTLSAGLIDWPAGAGQYLFGAFFMAHMAERYGQASLTQFNHRYGGDAIPYGVNRAAYRVWGKTWPELYKAWEVQASGEALADLVVARAHGAIERGTALLPPHRHRNASVRPGTDEIAFFHQDGIHPSGIVLFEGGRPRRLVECWGGCRHAWSEDGARLYFMHASFRDGYAYRQGLYVYDMARGRIVGILPEVRLRAFSVDGDTLYLVEQVGDSVRILRQGLGPGLGEILGTLEEIYAGEPLEQIDALDVQDGLMVASRFDPGRRTHDIVMARVDDLVSHMGENWPDGCRTLESPSHCGCNTGTKDDSFGKDDVFRPLPISNAKGIAGGVGEQCSPTKNRTRQSSGRVGWQFLSEDGSIHLTPRFEPSGRGVVFSSDRTGFFEIYRHDLTTGRQARLTHAFDGIFDPVVRLDGDLIVTRYTSRGTTIAVIAGESLWDVSGERAQDREAKVYPDLGDVALGEAAGYRPWRWLWPQWWVPQAAWMGQGVRIGLSFDGRDFLDHHQYSVSLQYDTQLDSIMGSFQYVYSRLTWDMAWAGGMSTDVAYYLRDGKTQPFVYQTMFGSMAAIRVINQRLMSHSLNLGFRVEHTGAATNVHWSGTDPGARPPVLPKLGWRNAVTVRYGLSNVRQGEKALDANAGYGFSTSLRFEAPWLGASDYAVIGTLSGRAYWTMPYASSHTLGLRGAVGSSYSQDTSRNPFVVDSDNAMSLSRLTAFPGADVMLHGYPAGILWGRHYVFANATYRLGIADPVWAHETLPVAISRLSASVFTDWAYAWQDTFDLNLSKFALGAAFHVDFSLGYRLLQRLTLGYAYGTSPGGEHQFFVFWGY